MVFAFNRRCGSSSSRGDLVQGLGAGIIVGFGSNMGEPLGLGALVALVRRQ
jgi:hypothetical protein